MRALAIVALLAGLAAADKKVEEFPAVVGTKLTFTSVDVKDTWTTTITGDAKLVQYTPHNDVINWFSKAGFRVAADGIYIVGETLADLDQPPPAPAKAIALPFKKGGTGKVPGMIETTYTVGAKESVKVPAGTYSAWHVVLSDKANQKGDVWIAPGVGIVKIRLPTGRVDELVKIEPAK